MHVPSSLTISCDACLQVSDEESSQTKAFHFLFSHVGCRGLTQPEISHPKWNAFKRAAATSNLEFDLLRLTVCANYAHGPWTNGDRLVLKQQALESYLDKQSEDWFSDMAEEIARDAGESELLSEEQARASMSDFLDSEAIRNRGAFVKAKSWFGIIAALRSLVKHWTIQREAATAIMVETGGAFEDAKNADDGEEDDTDAPRDPQPPKKWTKADLYRAYSGRGPHAMNADFLNDPDLRSKAVLIIHVTAPLCLALQLN